MSLLLLLNPKYESMPGTVIINYSVAKKVGQPSRLLSVEEDRTYEEEAQFQAPSRRRSKKRMRVLTLILKELL